MRGVWRTRHQRSVTLSPQPRDVDHPPGGSGIGASDPQRGGCMQCTVHAACFTRPTRIRPALLDRSAVGKHDASRMIGSKIEVSVKQVESKVVGMIAA